MTREDRRLRQNALRQRIAARLHSENELDLLGKLNKCQVDYPMICESCGHHALGHTKCRRKWCPCCAPAIAADRNRRMTAAVDRFQWPLFITLTMKNVEDMTPAAIRTLRRAFGKLRQRKFWKKNVLGGVACMEVTNIGNGWHPHLHAVIDCRHFSAGEGEPPYYWSRKEKAAAYSRCAASVEKIWSKILKQPTSSIFIKRARKDTILKEVVKYTVKGTDLAECAERIGPLIHAIDSCRLMTTFGNAYRLGKVKKSHEHKEIEFDPETGEELDPETPCGCWNPALIPLDVWDGMNRAADKRAHRR